MLAPQTGLEITAIVNIALTMVLIAWKTIKKAFGKGVKKVNDYQTNVIQVK